MTDTPPPLTRETYAAGRREVRGHDHAVCVYEGPAELGAAFGAFLREGLTRRDLTVFVHSFRDDDEAWGFVEKAHPEASRLRKDQLVLVHLYEAAFEGGNRRIDQDHVTGVIGRLSDMVRRNKLHGLRIFVDASRQYFTQQREKEWFAFESWLGRRLQADVGLVCAYQREDATRPDLFPEMLRTHSYRFEAPR